MARPRKSNNSRQSILEQGVILLSEQGYNGTGLKQILDAVQVPKGSFYNYFDSKEHFAAEIIRHYMNNLMAGLDDFITASNSDPRETLRTAYRYAVDQMKEDDCRKGCLLGNLAAEIGASSSLCQKALQESWQNWKLSVLPLIQSGQEQGLFRTDVSADDLTDLFWNLWEGGLLRMKLEGSTEQLSRSLDLTLDHLFNRQSAQE